jgi:hypothetical protein
MRLPSKDYQSTYYNNYEAVERLTYPRFKATLWSGELTIVEELETDRDLFYNEALSNAIKQAYEWIGRNANLMGLYRLNEDEAIDSLINEEVKAIKEQI